MHSVNLTGECECVLVFISQLLESIFMKLREQESVYMCVDLATVNGGWKCKLFLLQKLNKILWVYFCKINKIWYHNFTSYLNFSLFIVWISKLKSWLVLFSIRKKTKRLPETPTNICTSQVATCKQVFPFRRNAIFGFLCCNKKTRRGKRNRRKI